MCVWLKRGQRLGCRVLQLPTKHELWKDFYPNFLQPFLENIDRRSCNDGSWELMLVLHNPHRKGRSPPSAVSLTLENLVGVPSKAALSGKEKKKQVWIHNQKTCERPIVSAATYRGPTTAVSLHREGNECQLQTLLQTKNSLQMVHIHHEVWWTDRQTIFESLTEFFAY